MKKIIFIFLLILHSIKIRAHEAREITSLTQSLTLNSPLTSQLTSPSVTSANLQIVSGKTLAINDEQDLVLESSDYGLITLSKTIKPKLAVAYFDGKQINCFLASAIMQMPEKSQAFMSFYDASAFLHVNHKHTLNPILQALYCRHENESKLDVKVISDHKNIFNKPQFLLFNKFLKNLECDVKKFDPVFAQSNGLKFNTYSSLHQKFYVFDSLSLAVITSHNPTQHASTDDQINNAVVIGLPNIINQLKERLPEELNLLNSGLAEVELLESPLTEQSDHPIVKKIIEEINQETKCIRLANYQFSHAPIVLALASALDRGVRVECLVDSGCLSNETTDGGNVHNLAATLLQEAISKNQNNGFLKFVCKRLLHNKFYLFEDRKSVITGSLNCSGNSKQNCAEINIIITNQELLEKYQNQFADISLDAKILKLSNLKANHLKLIKSRNYSYHINGWSLDQQNNFCNL
jgi:hypothetical protein